MMRWNQGNQVNQFNRVSGVSQVNNVNQAIYSAAYSSSRNVSQGLHWKLIVCGVTAIEFNSVTCDSNSIYMCVYLEISLLWWGVFGCPKFITPGKGGLVKVGPFERTHGIAFNLQTRWKVIFKCPVRGEKWAPSCQISGKLTTLGSKIDRYWE